jgi:hypothetical protein
MMEELKLELFILMYLVVVVLSRHPFFPRCTPHVPNADTDAMHRNMEIQRSGDFLCKPLCQVG